MKIPDISLVIIVHSSIKKLKRREENKMDLKEYENFKSKKFVSLEKEYIEKLFCVLVTENGYQWSEVFKGRKEHCRIIIDAYKKIGYKGKKKN